MLLCYGGIGGCLQHASIEIVLKQFFLMISILSSYLCYIIVQ